MSSVRQRDRSAATASAMLRHPLRVRILEVSNERDISPVQFLREKLAPGKYTLSHISHHFSVLEKGGCLEVVQLIPRRGSVEHIYRGHARAFISDEEWANALTDAERRKITRTVLQGLIARAEGAILAETMDKRMDRHLSWLSMRVDEQAWSQLAELQAEALERAEAIMSEAAERVGSEDVESFPATFGALAFESPSSSAAAREARLSD